MSSLFMHTTLIRFRTVLALETLFCKRKLPKVVHRREGPRFVYRDATVGEKGGGEAIPKIATRKLRQVKQTWKART